jgi:hypothetical protein
MANIHTTQGYHCDIVKALDSTCFSLGHLPTILLPLHFRHASENDKINNKVEDASELPRCVQLKKIILYVLI